LKKLKIFKIPFCAYFPIEQISWCEEEWSVIPDRRVSKDIINQFTLEKIGCLVNELKIKFFNEEKLEQTKFLKNSSDLFLGKMLKKNNFSLHLLKIKYRKNIRCIFLNERKKTISLINRLSPQKIFIAYQNLISNKNFEKFYNFKSKKIFEYSLRPLVLNIEGFQNLLILKESKLKKSGSGFSRKIFQRYFFKIFKKFPNLFIIKVFFSLGETIKKGFFSRESYKIRRIVNTKIKKKKDNTLMKRKFLKFFLLRTKNQSYLISDEDFLSGFVVIFCKNKKWNICLIKGILFLERLKNENQISIKRNEDNLYLNIIVLIVRDLVILLQFDENNEKISLKSDMILYFIKLMPKLFYFEKLKFLKDEIETDEIYSRLKDFLHISKSIIKNLWYKNIFFFLWKTPEFRLWNIRKSNFFQLKLIKFHFSINILSREIYKKILLKKEKTFLFFKFKKRKKRSERQRIIRKKKFDQKKIIDFYKKINLLVVLKKRMEKKNSRFSKKKPKIDATINSSLPVIELKIRNLEFFKKKTYMLFGKKVMSDSYSYISKIFSEPSQMQKKKNLTKNQKLYIKKSIFFRIGFVFCESKKKTLNFLGYKFIFCFIFFPEEGKLFQIKFIFKKNKNLIYDWISVLKLKKLKFTNFKIIKIKRINFLAFLPSRKFQSKRMKTLRKIMKKIWRKSYKEGKKIYPSQLVRINSMKEKGTLEKIVFFTKNTDFFLLFNHFLNYILFGVDSCEKLFFRYYNSFYETKFFKIFWKNISVKFVLKKKKSKYLGKFFLIFTHEKILKIYIY